MIKYILLIALLHFVAFSYNKTQSMSYASLSAITHCSQNSIESWNCQQCSKISGFINVTYISNTQTHIVGLIGYHLTTNRIIIAFRGTIDAKNWAQDLDFQMIAYGCKGCRIHAGFYLSYKSVESSVRSALDKLLKVYSTAKIIVTGHSLGGSLSTVCGLELQNQYGKVEEIHNFGSPRVGNQHLVQFIKSKVSIISRVVHHKDIVPHLPPKEALPYQYRHVPYQIFYDEQMNNYKICDDSGEDKTCSDQYDVYSFSDHGIYWIQMDC